MRVFMTAALAAAMAFSVLLATGSTASANGLAGGGFSSSYAGESVFEGKAAGETGQFSAIFFNDGTQAWAPSVVGLLICLPDKVTCNVASPNASYATGWFSSTVYATVSAAVAPGQNGFFIYNFKVPDGTVGNTVATFNGDVGLIATGAELRPEGYFQTNTTPAVTGTLTISPTSASMPVAGQQQFTATTNLTGTVAFSVSGNCGAVTPTGLFVATAVNSSTQPCSVVASIGSLTASAAITVFGPAASLSCSASPTTIVANSGATNGTSTMTITVKDASGNTVATSTPSITVTNATPTLATVTPSGALAATNGVLTVTVASTSNSGQIVVSASSATNITGCTQLITSGSAGTATQTAASFNPNPIAADNVSVSTLRIDVEDANGARTTDSIAIDASLSSGAGICVFNSVITGTGGSAGGGSATTTTVGGRAEFGVKSTAQIGTCTVTATPRASGISASSATLTTRIVGSPTQLAVTANDSPHPAGSASASLTKVTVVVQDALGSQVTSATNAITATLDSGSCTGAGGGDVVISSSGATSGGQAVFQFTSNGAYSGCRVNFSSGSLTSTSTTLVFTPGAADHLTCGFNPTVISATAGSTSVALVRVADQSGNALTTGSYSVNFSFTRGDGVTSLVTSNPQTMSNGVASFTVKSTGAVGTDTYTPSLSTGTLPNIVANQTCQIQTQ
jgi:hypothetical protein